MLMLARNATVTYCHSHTTGLPDHVRGADIVIDVADVAGVVAGVDPGSTRNIPLTADEPARRATDLIVFCARGVEVSYATVSLEGGRADRAVGISTSTAIRCIALTFTA